MNVMTKLIQQFSSKPPVWWKSITGHSSDVIERCDYGVGSIFRLGYL